MECREHCGACCIAPSISSPIPGMPQGKKAGERCVQLDSHNRCKIFQTQDRPKVCGNLQPSREMCKESTEEAFEYLKRLQQETEPN